MEIKASEWRKWNFLVHTKGTNKNDQFSSSTIKTFFHVFLRKHKKIKYLQSVKKNVFQQIGIQQLQIVHDIFNKDSTEEKLFIHQEIAYIIFSNFYILKSRFFFLKVILLLKNSAYSNQFIIYWKNKNNFYLPVVHFKQYLLLSC